MTEFNFSPEENMLINDCIKKGHNEWKNNDVKDLKDRIKVYLRERQKDFCCYCLRNLHNEFKLVIDIEHVLPKHQFVDFMFNLDNLAASCKRCNMQMKGRRVDFINECFHRNPNPFATENYKFIHPNTDVFVEHIKYIFSQEGTNILISYSVINNSKKGKYSLDFFKLKRLERNLYDKAQGLNVDDEDHYDGDLDDDDIDDNNVIAGSRLMDIEGIIDDLASINGQT